MTGSKYSKFENSMMNATNAMNFAPMLSVLFIGARMRALQMDPVNGAPQKWAQNCFYMCTYATAAQVIISVAVTLVLSGTSTPNKDVEGDMVFKVENKALGTVLSIGRYLIMFCIYVGFSCVIYSIFTIQHPKGDLHATHLCDHAVRDQSHLPVLLHLPHDMDLRNDRRVHRI